MAAWTNAFLFPLSAFAIVSQLSVSAKVLPFDFSAYPECALSTTVDQEPLPKAVEAFSVRVEEKPDLHRFYDSDSYFDRRMQRGVTYSLDKSSKSVALYDFAKGAVFSIAGAVQGQTCKREDLWVTKCNPLSFFLWQLAGYANIMSSCNIVTNGLVYQGVQETAVRAISVQMWEQCMHDHKRNLTYKNSLYFTAPEISGPSTNPENPAPIPVRFESTLLGGEGAPAVQTNDLTHYIPEIKDKSVFSLEPGVKCPEWGLQQASPISAKQKAPPTKPTPPPPPKNERYNFAIHDYVIVPTTWPADARTRLMDAIRPAWTKAMPAGTSDVKAAYSEEELPDTGNTKVEYTVMGVVKTSQVNEYEVKKNFREEFGKDPASKGYTLPSIYKWSGSMMLWPIK